VHEVVLQSGLAFSGSKKVVLGLYRNATDRKNGNEMFLVFAIAVNGDVGAFARWIKGNVVSGSNSKRPAIVQVHDETLPGMLKLQEPFCDRHDMPNMGQSAWTDQRRFAESSLPI
jgi:hypothetical protein